MASFVLLIIANCLKAQLDAENNKMRMKREGYLKKVDGVLASRYRGHGGGYRC
jgi:hypothetical protein